MFKIIVSCHGVPEQIAVASIADIMEEFTERPWQRSVMCYLENGRLKLQAINDFDSTGQALLDEYSDVICASIPITDGTIGFDIESVSVLANCES